MENTEAKMEQCVVVKSSHHSSESEQKTAQNDYKKYDDKYDNSVSKMNNVKKEFVKKWISQFMKLLISLMHKGKWLGRLTLDIGQ